MRNHIGRLYLWIQTVKITVDLHLLINEIRAGFLRLQMRLGGSTSSSSNGYALSFHLRHPVQNVLHEKEHETNVWTSEYLNEYLIKEGKEHQSDLNYSVY